MRTGDLDSWTEVQGINFMHLNKQLRRAGELFLTTTGQYQITQGNVFIVTRVVL